MINDWTIARLPVDASAELPSRGQAMVEGTINGYAFHTPLEPDGVGSHWFVVDEPLCKAAKIDIGKPVQLVLSPVALWPEPDVPADLQQALDNAPAAYALWQRVTPMSRWEWIRWIRATNSHETRARRIEAGSSKLTQGKRRPCCWNRNACSEPAVSKNGVLLALE